MAQRTTTLEPDTSGFSRRDFLRGSGAVAAAATISQETTAALAQEKGAKVASGQQTITLDVNGKAQQVKVEPRTTLLEALRYQLDLTGAKPVCTDGSSGGATVLVDGKPMQANTMLAMQAVGKKITTVEGLAEGRRARGVRRVRRPAVRLLHARLRRRRAGLLEYQTQGDGRRDSQGPQRQPLPLRHLCQRHSSGPQGRERRRLMAEYSWPAKEKTHRHRQARQARSTAWRKPPARRNTPTTST